MSSLLCCNRVLPYHPLRTDHEAKFTSFAAWVAHPRESNISNDTCIDTVGFVIQIVRQVNFGPIETKRYFTPDSAGGFAEVSEQAIIDANFAKVNSYKNFKCAVHNKFYELNLYQRDPTSKHHWRANVARPAGNIDL